MKAIKIFLVAVVMMTMFGVGFVYSGLYPMGADEQHNAATYWLLEDD